MADSRRGQGRVDYLRLSITDRCNLRCTYCMPPEGVPARSHSEILSYEELAAFARVAAGVGISKVRITGGEPLVRLGCADFVGMLSRTSGVRDISLTTNGLLLPRYAADLAANGLHRVNISLDSLDAERFGRITRGGDVEAALAGLDAAFSAGFSPVKVNTLLLPGVEEELDAFVALIREYDVHVRFIEFMPLDRRVAGGEELGGEGRLLSAGDILSRLAREYDVVGSDGPYGHGPARYWKVAGARGSIGFIAGVSGHFCDSCNRLRLTADGRLRTCLFSGRETDVRPLLADPGALRDAIETAVAGKTFDRCAEGLANDRAMSQIGG
ncbi:MAG: GTP 3',8-cyclase MoaA [Actinobacteria bacterium]|nr:GTP 3',8-cyclase MoaA [Actinomycetota bacterium]